MHFWLIKLLILAILKNYFWHSNNIKAKFLFYVHTHLDWHSVTYNKICPLQMQQLTQKTIQDINYLNGDFGEWLKFYQEAKVKSFFLHLFFISMHLQIIMITLYMGSLYLHYLCIDISMYFCFYISTSIHHVLITSHVLPFLLSSPSISWTPSLLPNF